eukprot:s5093_g3.t1
MGAIELQNLQEQIQSAPTTQHRILLDMLPRGRKFKPLVSEYGTYQKWGVACNVSEQCFLQRFPKGSKIVHRQFQQGIFRADEHNFDEVMQHESCKVEHDKHEIFTVGIPREPLDFLGQAVRAGHPRTIAIHLPEMVTTVLAENFGDNDHALVKARAAFLWKWSRRAKELARDEEQFHASLPQHLQFLLKGKRLLLLKEVLEDLGYPDVGLVDEIASGFNLHGWMSESGAFPKETKRPEYTVDMVKSMALGINKMILAQVNATEEGELASATWASTLDEIDKQWVWRDVTSDTNEVILAKRFGLQQKNKIRVIDDCSIGGYNKAYGTKEKLKVHAIDQLAAYLSWLCTEVGPRLDDEVVGRTYDLRSAYKQFGVSCETRNLLRLIVWDADQRKPCLLGVNALPFGAAGSVNAFLRISMALWFIGTVGLRLSWTVFYDDFTVICKKRLSRGTGIAAEALFDLFGMWYAKEGSKAVEFDTQVKTLGLLVKLGNVRAGFSIGHTEERREELRLAFLDVLEKKTIEPKQAERLRGRMQWFEGYAFGRVAQHSLKVLGEISTRRQKLVHLSDVEMNAVNFLYNRISGATALRVNSTCLETFLIFTDGACEGESGKVGSIGGVLVSPAGKLLEHFSTEVPEDFMKLALAHSENPIYELELLPIYVALALWKTQVISTHVIFYLDNDAARAALCKGYGATVVSQTIVHKVMLEESRLELKSWYARVPTHSNISDGPNRMDCGEVTRLGSEFKEVDWKHILENLLL